MVLRQVLHRSTSILSRLDKSAIDEVVDASDVGGAFRRQHDHQRRHLLWSRESPSRNTAHASHNCVSGGFRIYPASFADCCRDAMFSEPQVSLNWTRRDSVDSY